MRILNILLAPLCAVILALVYGCGGSATTPTTNPGLAAGEQPAPVEAAWPKGLPTDALQPWEQLDSGGKVAAGLNTQSEFIPGVERHLDTGAALNDLGEAVHIESGEPGSGTVSWVMYRLTMGNEQPGVVSADVNLGEMSDGSLSSYYVGLSNYGEGRWDWHGPFTDSHVRLSTGADVAAGADYLSALGNHFVTVVAFDGAVFDVVGIGTNAYTAADTEAPPVPTGLFAVPVYGGLDLQWNNVLAGDLAGYRVYYGDADFSAVDEAGAQHLDYLIGQDTHLLIGLSEYTYVRISAVDISGNESALSDSVSQIPLGGSGPALRLGTAAASGLINDSISLAASGAVNYDWDLDGDGVYEITGDTTGIQSADTTRTGILRPGVRGTTEDGSCVSCAAVSLIITANSRPLANAYADPASGDAPLLTSLTGSGIDDDGTIVSWSWDFDGDGVFDQTDNSDTGPVERTYTAAGFYNAKFRVEDNEGSWDIDTVGVLVNPAPAPANTAPTAVLTIGTGEETGDAPHSVHFDASGSSDPDSGDSIVRYWWDLDGDGMYEGATTTATYNYTYPNPGVFTAEVMVEDSHGDCGTDTVSITINVVGNDLPVADLTSDVTNGDTPLTVGFDATGSSDSDGSIVRYDYDFNGDGNYELYDGGDSPSWQYTGLGTFQAAVRVTDDDGAQDVDTLTILVNALPVASLSASPDQVDVGEAFGLYAGDSTDSDGTIVDYEWDLDDDGIYNEIGEEADNHGIASIATSLSACGPQTVSIRVTDDDGGQDTAGVEITVFGWTPVEVVTTGDVGEHCSLKVIAGFPAIAYYNATNGDLEYVRATDSAGGNWGTPEVVHSTGDVGKFCSLAEIDGRPAISFYDTTNDDLMYARSSDPAGNVWYSAEIVDSSDNTGQYTCLALVNGNPAISYYDATTKDLNYIRATNAGGTSWGTPVQVFTSQISGQYNSLAVVDGNPAISFITSLDGGAVRYVRADDADGSTWPGGTIVTAWKSLGWETSLVEVNGLPAITYYCITDGDLYYTLGGTANGGGWTIQKTIDESGDVGKYSSLAIIDGVPVVAYYKDGVKNAKMIRAGSETGSGSWLDPEKIESDGDVGTYISLMEVEGKPAVAYYAENTGDLRYARLY